jgi:hypothetical protein
VGVFGEKLRKQREQRGLELEAISNTTKISIRMLRALEEEQFQQLPGGVFNRGFVRAYARQVGLNEEEAIADYVTALRESMLPDLRAPEPEPTPVAAPAPVEQKPDIDRVPENVPENVVETVLPSPDLPVANHKNDDGVVQTPEPQNPMPKKLEPQIAELREEDRRKQGRRNNEDRRNEERRNQARRDEDRLDEDRRHQPQAKARAANPLASRFRQKYPAGTPTEPASQSSVEVPWGKLAVALLLVTLTLAFWNFRPHAQPTAPHPAASSNQSTAPVSTPASSASQPPGSATSPRVETPSPAGTQSGGNVSSAPIPAGTASLTNPASASSSDESQPESKPRVTHSAAAKPPATFSLLIRADETTWVSLMIDGKPAPRETLIAPAHTSVRATHEIVVKTGNAAGVSFQLNGKPIPAQGREGQAITYLFDATSVHVVP